MEFIDNITPDYTNYKAALPSGYIGAAKDQDQYNSWLSMYIPNAYQAAMLNYQNEYEKPINQMLRYQQAGLNPYSFQHQQSASGAQGAAIKPSTANQEIRQQKIDQVLKGVSTLSQAAGAARELFDYMNFGRFISASNKEIAVHNTAVARSNRYWTEYWNGPVVVDEGGNSYIDAPGSPRAQYMQFSTQRIQAQISQLDSMVNTLYPSQVSANEARAALQAYQKQLLQGQNDAILDINTGNELADSILKMLAFWIKNSLNLGNVSQML